MKLAMAIVWVRTIVLGPSVQLGKVDKVTLLAIERLLWPQPRFARIVVLFFVKNLNQEIFQF